MNRITKRAAVLKGISRMFYGSTYIKRLLLSVLCAGLFVSVGHAQNMGINTNGAKPDPSAILDLNTGNVYTSPGGKGLLLPYVKLASTTDKTTVQNPATSLLVYVPALSGLTPSGYYYNSGTSSSPLWTQLGATSTTGWLLLGNTNTTAGTNFVGTQDAQDMVFKTAGAENMRITNSNGYVGVNTSTPANQLDVKGNEAVGTYGGTVAGPANGLVVSGQVGIGIATPTLGSALEVASSTEGMLIPRSTTAPTGTTPTSLLYYDLNQNCFMFYNGTNWQPIVCACSTVPAIPVITGSSSFCSGSTSSYQVSAVTGALYYTWTVPSGTTITSGQGTNKINVTYGSVSGNITCNVTNSCGTSTVGTFAIAQEISIPITIKNTGSTITPVNFQQMVTVNSSLFSAYELSGLQNVEFSTGLAGAGPLYAWLESGDSNTSTNTIWWVNLGSLQIGSSGGTTTIYLNCMLTTIMGNATSITGEAPQLSTPYAQYDNGSMVFTSCYNAWGGGLPGVISTTATGTTITPSTNYTQVTFTGGNDGNAHGVYYTTTPASATTYPSVLESYVAMTGLYMWFGTGNGIEEGGQGVTIEYDQGFSGTDFGFKSNQGGAGANTVLTTGPITTNPVVWSLVMGSNTSLTSILDNYTQVLPTESVASTAPQYYGFFGTTQNGGTNTQNIYWTRTRIYPPSGTMPTVTVGPGFSCP